MAFQYKGKIKLFGSELNHKLSVQSSEYISIQRYKNLHYYEAMYHLKYENKTRIIIYMTKLLARFFKILLKTYKND